MKETEIRGFVTKTRLLKGIKSNTLKDKSYKISVSGWTAINRKRLELTLNFGSDFPNEKPVIILNNLKEFGLLPHVSAKGIVCFLDDEGIIINSQNPEGIILESLQQAIKTLRESLSKSNRLDFFQEFNAYFDYFPSTCIVNSILPIENKIIRLKVLNVDGAAWLSKNKLELSQFIQKGFTQSEINRMQDFIYIPLQKDAFKKIPLPKPDSFWTLPQLRSIIFKSLEGKSSYLRRLLNEIKTATLIISIPLLTDTNILFGVDFGSQKSKKHPLLDVKSTDKPIPIKVNRMDKDYLLNRGGSDDSLTAKNVAIIGCGAIGSIVAMELAKAGILNLYLIDNDTLSNANLYRHLLGFNSGIDKPKVEGLKEEIEQKLPLTSVNIYPFTFQRVLETKTLDFSKIDLVVNATGIPNTSFLINEYFRENYPGTPVINTWVEPYGIGGHILVDNNGITSGCYRCIFVMDNKKGLYNSIAFAAAGQTFRKSIAGCAARFTPFSSLDANRSATESVRLAIELLKGIETGNPLLSWKGKDIEFRKNGFKTSKRYNLTVEELFADRYNYKKQNCSICSI